MSLKVVEITDLRDFTREFVTIVGVPQMDPHNRNLTEGINLGIADGTQFSGPFNNGAYFHNADLYFWWNQFNKNASVGGARQVYGFLYAHDALCRDSRRGWYRPHTFQPTFGSGTGITHPFGSDGNTSSKIAVGQPNLQTGQQSFFRHGALNGMIIPESETYVSGWHRFNCADGSRQNFFEDFWPQVSSDFSGVNGGAVDGGTAGYWVAATGVNANLDPYHALVFEGITDTTGGMPGETSASAGMLRAVTSHPKGLLLIRSRASNFLGNGTPSNLDTRWIWVDITTGLAVGVLGQSGIVNSFSTNTFHDESFDHKQFEWERVQFVPDDGSAYDRPKGELHFSLSTDRRFGLPDQSIQVGSASPFTSLVNRQFVKVVDFNPFNETIGQVRIHNRQRFLGILDTPVEPIQDGGVSLPAAGTVGNRRSPGIYYHPPSRSWVNVQSSFFNASNAGPDEPAVGASRIIRWARQTTVEQLTAPTPDEAVRESSLLTIRLLALNDFGEPVAGETVNFRTNRQSTRDEQFNGTTQAATNYVVARGVIDEDGSLQIYSGGGIDSGGTLLALGVDYTVSSYATGTLAPVGSWPTATISVRYRHRSAPVYPGFGSVISTSSVTNADGVATVVLELGTSLRGELLGLEASSEVFV